MFSAKSLKEDQSIDTTLDPCYFSWDIVPLIYHIETPFFEKVNSKEQNKTLKHEQCFKFEALKRFYFVTGRNDPDFEMILKVQKEAVIHE